MLREPDPVLTAHLFAEDRAALVEVLGDLTDDEWARSTACAGWSVRDVAAHLLGVDLHNLSRRRDDYRGPKPLPDESIVAFVNRINDEWMVAGRRLSPRVIRDLLAAVGPPLFEWFRSLDAMALGAPVSWAGPEPAPVWLDVAREYTERWHHQQHIRDAVGRPGQTTRRFLHPVLATFAHALPVALQAAEAPVGATAHLHVTGEAGGDWTVRRESSAWRLCLGAPDSPSASATLDGRTAWRAYTKGLTPEEAVASATLHGDRRLAIRLLHAVAIIA